VTTVVVLGVFVYLSVSPAASGGADRLVVIALALGAVLLLLGYEGVIRMPIIGRDDKPEDREDRHG